MNYKNVLNQNLLQYYDILWYFVFYHGYHIYYGVYFTFSWRNISWAQCNKRLSAKLLILRFDCISLICNLTQTMQTNERYYLLCGNGKWTPNAIFYEKSYAVWKLWLRFSRFSGFALNLLLHWAHGKDQTAPSSMKN